jgi:signal transduction histidine kinase
VAVSERRPDERAEQERETPLTREVQARAAAEAAERRMQFLAEASELLHSSLDVKETFGALVRLIVPKLASCCVIDLVDESGRVGRVHRAHSAHADPAKAGAVARLREYPSAQSRYLTRRAIDEGTSELVPLVTADFLRSIAEDDEHLLALRALDPRSIVIVPMRARDRSLGAMLLCRDAPSPPYDDGDVALAEQLALRAASALDNARHYETARRAIRARDDVLGVVSHDLRRPLAAISMCATSLLAEGFADETRTRGALQTIQQSAHWAQRLIQDLLDVSAIGAGGLSIERRAEDPVILVMRAAMLHEQLAADRGLSLLTELPESLPRVHADGDRILQALSNLIGNACRFTPRRGTVRVGAETRGEMVRFYVSDDGPGVPADDAPHVFDRYWTARRAGGSRGTGVGLAIVRGIAEAHGGRAWLEPARTSGATFSIAVPVAPDAVR